MPIKLNTASGGGVILQGANTASDKTITIPADDGTMIYANSSGNVGIGTSSPSSKLDINNGSLNLSVGYNLQWGGNGNQAIAYTSSSLVFYNGAERARIDSSGNLLVGATSNLGSVRGLFVNANSIQVAYRNSSATAGNYWATGVDSGNFFYIQNQNSTGVYITPTGTSWTALSDERTKDIIEPITGAADKVVSLRAVIGKYKTDEDGTRRAFLIAQDVQAVLPEAVNEQPDGRLGIQYTDTIPLLVAAIQEQQAMIEELKAKVAALEAK